jgi:integrase
MDAPRVLAGTIRPPKPHAVRPIVSGAHGRHGVGDRLTGAVERANAKRAEEGKQLLPDRVRPHTLRRTFASLALAAGRNPRWVMAQLGHADARLTLSIYPQVVQRQATHQALIWRLMRFAGEPEEWTELARLAQ